MQLNYRAGTPQSMGFTGTREDLKRPDVNIYWGSKYFFWQLDRYRDVDRAILAYNAGSYRETAAGLPINLDYLRGVLSFLTEKKTLLGSWRELLLSLSSTADPDATIGEDPPSPRHTDLSAVSGDRQNVTPVTSSRALGRLTIAGGILAGILSTLAFVFGYC